MQKCRSTALTSPANTGHQLVSLWCILILVPFQNKYHLASESSMANDRRRRSTTTSRQSSAVFQELPYFPFSSPLDISFQDLPDKSDRIYNEIAREAKLRGFEPPPKPEVATYMNKSLPTPPLLPEVQEEFEETKVQSVRCQTPCVTLASEKRPVSCSACIRASFTQQSIAPTMAEQQPSVAPTWMARLRKRDEGNQKCHVQHSHYRSSTWS